MADMTLAVKITGDASSLSSAVDSAKSKIDSLHNSINNGVAAGGVAEIGSQVEKVGNKISSFGRSYTTKVTAPIVGGAALAVKSYKDWESAFTGVMKTVDETATTSYKDLEKSIKQIAMETASSREEVAGVAEIAGQLGVSADNLADFTKTMVILGDTTNLSCEEAAMSLAKVMNVMGDAPDDVDNLASVIVDLGNNFATTEKDIVEMSERLAPYGRTVGLTTSEVMALSTAMSSVGIRSEAGGTAMGRVLSKIDNQVKKSGLMLKDYAKVAGMSVEDFSKLWESRPVEAFQKVVEGLHKVKEEGGNVHDVLDNLGLGGEVRVKSMMLSLAESGDLLSRTLDTATTAFDENTAATEEAEKRYKTFEAKLSQTKEHIKAAGDAIGEQLLPYILKLLDGVQKVTDAFVKLSPEQQKFIIAIGGIAAAIGPVLLVLGKITSSVGFMMTAFSGAGSSLLPVLGSLGKFVGIAGLVVAGFIALYQNSESFREAVGNLVNTSLQSLMAIFEALKPALESIWNALQPLISALGDLLAPLIDILAASIEFLTPLLVGLIDAFAWLVEAISPVIDWISQLISILGDSFAATVEVVSGLINDVIEWFKKMGDTIDHVKETVSNAWDMIKNAVEVALMFIVELLETYFELITLPWRFIWENCKEYVFTAWEKIKTTVSEALKPIVEWISNAWDTIKTTTSEIWDAITEKAQIVFNAIHDHVVEPTEKAVGTVEDTWSRIKEKITGWWDDIKTSASETWEGIKEAVTGPIEEARDTIVGAWKKVKDTLEGAIDWPDIKVPHFTTTGSFSLDPPSVPHFGFEWMAKGGIVNKASVVGVGEAGPEAIAPIDKLKAYVAEAVTNARSATMDYTPIDSLADAIATGFAMQSAGQNGGEYHFTVELGGARVAEKIFTLNKEGQMIMQGA